MTRLERGFLPLIALLTAFFLLIPSQSAAHGPAGEEKQASSDVVVPSGEYEAATDAQPHPGQERSVTMTSAMKNLHPATVHFPIGLLVAAALAELLAWRRKSAKLEHAVEVMVGFGAISAVVAAVFGWIHTGLWMGGDGTMQFHRWIGTGLALAAPLLWWLVRREAPRTGFRILLFAVATILLWQGFMGAELGHGADHLM